MITNIYNIIYNMYMVSAGKTHTYTHKYTYLYTYT